MIEIDREQVLALDDVARMLRVTTKTVRNWASGKNVRKRRLETFKVGGAVRTTREAVEKFRKLCSKRPLETETAIDSIDSREKARIDAVAQRVKSKHGI